MQTNPPSVGNIVKLNPLGSALDSFAYTGGYITLKGAEPSLGLPSGYTLTTPNSVYYFPVIAIADSYGNSRRYTGDDSFVLVNKNLGFNNTNPTFNVDINGNFHALSAYIPNLSAIDIVPSADSNTIYFNANKVVFNSNLYANNNTFINKLTANEIYTEYLNAVNKVEQNTIINIYQLTGAYVDHDVVIAGNLTSTNVFATSSIITPFLSATSALFTSLTSNYVTINQTLSVGNNVYAKNIYGQVDLDPFSQLFYNNSSQLSIGNNNVYVFAVRPSDAYSTDNISTPRTVDGDWDSNYGQIREDANVLRPYFKNLQAVFDYVYYNGLVGRVLYIWVDEDIIEGEDKPNLFTTDRSGKYAGCTITGNLTGAYYSTEWLGANYPSLTAAGMLGGDFLWSLNKNADISGQFSYLNIPPIDFLYIDIHGRTEIGSSIYTDGSKYYSTWKPFNASPKKISFRTYICANPTLSYGSFNDTTVAQLSTWNTVTTKSLVQGRQVQFNHKNNLYITNICFEFNTNAVDSTGLVVYDGVTQISNTTISLLGTGIYTYGALVIDSEAVLVHITGENCADPIFFTRNSDNTSRWETWNKNGYTYENPLYFPGYGLAIVGNPFESSPTIVNFGPNTYYTGLINANNGAVLEKIDYGTSRVIGRNSFIKSSLILDGKFNANALFQLGDNASIQSSEQIYRTDNFKLSSKQVKANNTTVDNVPPTYKLEIYEDPKSKVNFKFINFAGSFSKLSYNKCGFTPWTFSLNEPANSTDQNTIFTKDNGNVSDLFYKFVYPLVGLPYVDLLNSVNSTGHLNTLVPSQYNTSSRLYYINYESLPNYDSSNAYRLRSPIFNYGNNNIYTLNFYASSSR
jgi:hypothetical protein